MRWGRKRARFPRRFDFIPDFDLTVPRRPKGKIKERPEFRQPEPPKAPIEKRLEKRLEEMNRRLEQLRKSIEELREKRPRLKKEAKENGDKE